MSRQRTGVETPGSLPRAAVKRRAIATALPSSTARVASSSLGHGSSVLSWHSRSSSPAWAVPPHTFPPPFFREAQAGSCSCPPQELERPARGTLDKVLPWHPHRNKAGAASQPPVRLDGMSCRGGLPTKRASTPPLPPLPPLSPEGGGMFSTCPLAVLVCSQFQPKESL